MAIKRLGGVSFNELATVRVVARDDDTITGPRANDLGVSSQVAPTAAIAICQENCQPCQRP